ncbi:MAG TPA: glycosyltransferase [Aridibacter sp.]|nr:glycosyltransferase [Aridibacter sp.]
MIRSLYICYFGLREPLVQTQVLPYLKELAKGGVGVTLLTFEPDADEGWDEESIEAERRSLSDAGIEWRHLKYHKRPSVPATLYDIAAGALFAKRLVRRNAIDVVHCRAHIPLAMGLIAKRLTGAHLIFDIRGFMADEYADAGIWEAGSLPFRAVKWLEAAGLRRADQIVVLTVKAKSYLIGERDVSEEKIEVIPCCVAFPAEDPGIAGSKRDRFELIYAGTVSGLYLLPEMADLFAELKRSEPDAFFRVLTFGGREAVQRVFKEKGVENSDYAVESVAPDRVADTVARAHLAISFRKPTFAQIAASPTKIPEYLSAGVPVITNSGIGDTDEFVKRHRVGVVVDGFDRETLAAAVVEALLLAKSDDIAERCREAASDGYSMELVGGPRYRSVYAKIGTEPETGKKKV